MKKGTTIKLKDGNYKLVCKDKDYLVFAKTVKHRDGSSTVHFSKTAFYSNSKEDIETYIKPRVCVVK